MLPHFLTIFKNSIRQIKEKSAIFLHFCFWGCLKFKQKSFFLGFLELFMCDEKKMVRPPESSSSRLKTVFESIGAYGFIGGGSWNRLACEDEDRPPTKEMVEREAKRTKNVLVLMSDTGGGHRASAEAIRDAFKIEFGDQYRIFIKDLCKEYAGWPLNDMENQYKFMVKHAQLWNVAFRSTSPRWIHNSYLTAFAAFYAKYIIFYFLLQLQFSVID
ncbi:monogalactosyldiacylglycerol synthase 2, chloroplastic-like [Bidens hawaiensis]|uniref:monogalactosyldiacylglycerol synthase 2, chloroplastic-like n=1 Tax=Bidens hawaiensis TaxID=980011 RepID=UPI00404B5E15